LVTIRTAVSVASQLHRCRRARLFAEAFRHAPATFTDWLGDIAVRDLKQLKAVCRVLGISLDELLFPDDREFFSENFNPAGNWICGLFEIKIRRIK
jgi:hypothetical protein